MPSIDSVSAGPVIGPNGHAREEDARSNIASPDSYVAEEREDVGPGSPPPPAYTEKYGELDINQDGMETHARIAGLSRKSNILIHTIFY